MNSNINDYILIKNAQAANYFQTPLYIYNGDVGFVLFKPANEEIDIDKLSEENLKNIFIKKSDRDHAIKEIQEKTKKKLLVNIHSGNIQAAKESICEIISETFHNGIDNSFESLPNTIDILYDGYSKASNLLRTFSDINYAGYPLVNHSANVMTIAMLYCLNNEFSEKETKRISLCALLHDIGVIKLPDDIVSSKHRLNDQQFKLYKTHAAMGHDIVKLTDNIDSTIAVGILEHHERLDGNGYPRGIANLTFEGKLIGLVDSFDSLINSEKTHRKKKRPFDAMLVIKDEVLEKGRFDKAIYKDLCLCLGRK